MKKSANKLYILAVICFIISGAMLYNGYDKMTNYYNSEYSESLNVNAYVGGDAYNFIINGTYSTAYFTLASGFMISGILSVIGGMLIKAIDSKELSVVQTSKEKSFENEQLPPL